MIESSPSNANNFVRRKRNPMKTQCFALAIFDFFFVFSQLAEIKYFGRGHPDPLNLNGLHWRQQSAKIPPQGVQPPLVCILLFYFLQEFIFCIQFLFDTVAPQWALASYSCLFGNAISASSISNEISWTLQVDDSDDNGANSIQKLNIERIYSYPQVNTK